MHASGRRVAKYTQQAGFRVNCANETKHARQALGWVDAVRVARTRRRFGAVLAGNPTRKARNDCADNGVRTRYECPLPTEPDTRNRQNRYRRARKNHKN